MPRFRLPADDLEYTVLSLLWELDEATVRELHERLGAPVGNVYTTTAKVVDRLRGKALVERRREGNTFVYHAAVDRRQVERARARQLITRFLGSAPRGALAALVEAADDIDPGLLDELECAIRNRREQGHGT